MHVSGKLLLTGKYSNVRFKHAKSVLRKSSWLVAWIIPRRRNEVLIEWKAKEWYKTVRGNIEELLLEWL